MWQNISSFLEDQNTTLKGPYKQHQTEIWSEIITILSIKKSHHTNQSKYDQ